MTKNVYIELHAPELEDGGNVCDCKLTIDGKDYVFGFMGEMDFNAGEVEDFSWDTGDQCGTEYRMEYNHCGWFERSGLIVSEMRDGEEWDQITEEDNHPHFEAFVKAFDAWCKEHTEYLNDLALNKDYL